MHARPDKGRTMMATGVRAALGPSTPSLVSAKTAPEDESSMVTSQPALPAGPVRNRAPIALGVGPASSVLRAHSASLACRVQRGRNQMQCRTTASDVRQGRTVTGHPASTVTRDRSHVRIKASARSVPMGRLGLMAPACNAVLVRRTTVRKQAARRAPQVRPAQPASVHRVALVSSRLQAD